MSALERGKDLFKTAVRENSSAYEVVRRRRARRQERAYVQLRDAYAARAPVFSAPGQLARSRELLASRWTPSGEPKRDLADVRLFAAVADDPGGPQLFRRLEEDFDSTLVDLSLYRRLDVAPRSDSLEWRKALQQELIDSFEAAHDERPVDLFFAYASHLELDRATLDRIRSHGVPVAVMCLDDKHLFAENPALGYPNGQAPLIGSVDVHLTNSRECVRWYMAEGAPGYYMPQGVDPELYQPVAGEPEIDVSFVGKRYGFRARLIEAIRASGIEVACFGPGWDRMISHEDKVKLHIASRVNLGIAGVAYSDAVTCVKGRDFEVPAVGGLYMTTYDPELAGLFELGREIVCYRTEIDCVEQIRYYIENAEERRAIAVAGRARTLRDHTWPKRFKALLDWMGITG